MTASTAPIRSKLQITDGSTGKIIACPDDVDLDIPENPDGTDFRIVFVRNAAEIRSTISSATDGLKEDGLLWYCYPKKSSGRKTDITRDIGWEPLLERGFRGVRQVAIDGVWSALRFRGVRQAAIDDVWSPLLFRERRFVSSR